jgi:hypothetical protein
MEVQLKSPTAKEPTEWFTGDVWIDVIAQAHGPSPISIGSMHFVPGARTAWHSHSNRFLKSSSGYSVLSASSSFSLFVGERGVEDDGTAGEVAIPPGW